MSATDAGRKSASFAKARGKVSRAKADEDKDVGRNARIPGRLFDSLLRDITDDERQFLRKIHWVEYQASVRHPLGSVAMRPRGDRR